MTPYIGEELIKTLINCEIITIKSFKINLSKINLSNLKCITIDGTDSSFKLQKIDEFAFYECDQIERIDLFNNEIDFIGENSLHFKNSSLKVLEIYLIKNNLNENSFAMNSLSNFKHPVFISLELNCIKYLDQYIFKPFFDSNEGNLVVLTENLFDFNDSKNVWHQTKVYDKYTSFRWITLHPDMPFYVGTISVKLEESIIVNKSINELFNSTSNDKQLCTFASNSNPYKQRWFHCFTCKLIGNFGVCTVCAQICHKDHLVIYAGFTMFFCDCGYSTKCNALQ